MILRILAAALACGLLAGAAAAQTAADPGEGASPRGAGRSRATRAVRAKPQEESAAEEGETKPTGRRGRASRRPAADTKPSTDTKPADAKPAADTKAGARPAARAGAAPAGLQATPVAVFGDWNVFAAGQGRARICYAITQPKTRQPASLKRDAAYLFVTVRKAENLPNEVALMMGFAARPGAQSAAGTPARGASDPTMMVGTASYGLVVKDANAWLQNPSDEGRVVAEMGRTTRLVVKATSLRGNASSDDYSLTGFGDAIKRAREECK